MCYRLLGAFNRRLQPLDTYSIKAGYHHAKTAEAFDSTSGSDEFQRSVYKLAESLAEKHELSSILDVGCGSAFKLVHMLGKYTTTGIEVEPTYSWLLQKYPERKWLLYHADMTDLHAHLVICSDVIEHIENPDDLMNFLKRINFKILVLSTPERDEICGKNDYGPPENTSHFREWNSAEFTTYVSRWFTIIEHHVFHDRSICQVVVCIKDN